MKNRAAAAWIVLAVCAGVWGWFHPLSAASAQVKQAPETVQNLDARWAWALAEAPKTAGEKGFYIVYSIERMMDEHSTIGCHRHDSDGQLTLNEVIYEKKLPGPASTHKEKSVSDTAKEALQRSNAHGLHKPGKKVLEEVAMLFHFNGKESYPYNCQEIRIRTMEQPVELDGCPVYWLGKAAINKSIALLDNFFKGIKRTDFTEIKEDLLTAVGIHGESPAAFSFLKRVLTGGEPDEIRGKAAFWMGQQQTPGAAALLIRTAENDRSTEVREKAVFGLYLVELKEADEALIKLAKSGSQKEVRKKAIFWLGQRAVKRCAEVLTGLVDSDEDTEIQNAAVFALSQLSGDQGLDSLIKIAKTHKSMAVRKKAIFWLSQRDHPRALETIIDILEK